MKNIGQCFMFKNQEYFQEHLKKDLSTLTQKICENTLYGDYCNFEVIVHIEKC